MSDNKTFRCRIMTAEGQMLAVDATSALLTLVDGMLGVLPDRQAFAAVLGKGKLVISRQARRYRYLVWGGMAHMQDNVLSILAERCEAAG